MFVVTQNPVSMVIPKDSSNAPSAMRLACWAIHIKLEGAYGRRFPLNASRDLRRFATAFFSASRWNSIAWWKMKCSSTLEFLLLNTLSFLLSQMPHKQKGMIAPHVGPTWGIQLSSKKFTLLPLLTTHLAPFWHWSHPLVIPCQVLEPVVVPLGEVPLWWYLWHMTLTQSASGFL